MSRVAGVEHCWVVEIGFMFFWSCRDLTLDKNSLFLQILDIEMFTLVSLQ